MITCSCCIICVYTLCTLIPTQIILCTVYYSLDMYLPHTPYYTHTHTHTPCYVHTTHTLLHTTHTLLHTHTHTPCYVHTTHTLLHTTHMHAHTSTHVHTNIYTQPIHNSEHTLYQHCLYICIKTSMIKHANSLMS